MYYLVGKYANVDRRIVTENHNIVQAHLKEADEGWDAEKIIKWMWGIEKKSKNVCDLIEVGDLVFGLEMFDEEYNIHRVTSNAPMISSIECGIGNFVDKNTIKTIYKPNSKGDYIKVWEREE